MNAMGSEDEGAKAPEPREWLHDRELEDAAIAALKERQKARRRSPLRTPNSPGAEMHDDWRLAFRSARILGEASAAWKALAEYDRRAQAGEDVGIWLVGNRWIVGPRPLTPMEPR